MPTYLAAVQRPRQTSLREGAFVASGEFPKIGASATRAGGLVSAWLEKERLVPKRPINEQDCTPLLGPAQVESVTTSQARCRMTASSSVETCEPAGSALAQVDASPSGPAVNRGAARKAWRHGFLRMTEPEYLNFLDWNARLVISGKPGAMDSSLPPILERIGVAPAFWLKMIENYDRWFRTAVGTAEHLAAEAVRTGRRWLHGIGPMRAASASG